MLFNLRDLRQAAELVDTSSSSIKRSIKKPKNI